MNLTQTQIILAAAALLFVGYQAGKRKGMQPDTSPAAHNDIAQTADWWTYAGSWGM